MQHVSLLTCCIVMYQPATARLQIRHSAARPPAHVRRECDTGSIWSSYDGTPQRGGGAVVCRSWRRPSLTAWFCTAARRPGATSSRWSCSTGRCATSTTWVAALARSLSISVTASASATTAGIKSPSLDPRSSRSTSYSNFQPLPPRYWLRRFYVGGHTRGMTGWIYILI